MKKANAAGGLIHLELSFSTKNERASRGTKEKRGKEESDSKTVRRGKRIGKAQIKAIRPRVLPACMSTIEGPATPTNPFSAIRNSINLS